MKALITILIGLLVVGCGKKQSGNTNESSNTPEKVEISKKQTLKDKITGGYEAKDGQDTDKFILMDNGIVEVFHNGKHEGKGTWKLEGEEVHVDFEGGVVFKLTDDGNLKVTSEGGTKVSASETPFIFKRIKELSVEEAKSLRSKNRALEEKVIGTYQAFGIGNGEPAGKYVLLDNGILESYLENGEKEHTGKWRVVEGEVRLEIYEDSFFFYQVNLNGDLTVIAMQLDNGSRKEISKDKQFSIKKIK